MALFVSDGRRQWLDDSLVLMLQSSEAERRQSPGKNFDAGELSSLATSKKKLLKESEKRKFRERVKLQFGCDALSASLLVPNSSSKVSRVELFYDDDGTLLFAGQEDKTTRVQELVPTVSALSRCPHLVRQLVVHGPVEKNVRRGADLFTPGILGCSQIVDGTGQAPVTWPRDLCGGPFSKGELVALVTPGKWAPFAIGRFSKSHQAMLEEGARGTAVFVCFRKEPASSSTSDNEDGPPPQQIIEMLQQLAADRQILIAESLSKQRDREAAEAAAKAASDREDLARNKRRLQKALRAVADLRLKDHLNEDQQEKLAREPAMVAELAEIEAALLVEPSPPLARIDDQTEIAPAVDNLPEAEVEDVSLVDAEESEIPDEEENVDDRFRDAFMTVLAETFPPRTRPKSSRLVAEIFAETAKLAGNSVKKTKWKKADRFVTDVLRDAVVTKERSRGVTEIVEVDWTLTPDFDHVAWPQKEDEEERGGKNTVLKTATKKGGQCTVSVRRVRNKNCTFIDGLDGWGYSEADMRAIASVFRNRFSASASVSPRKGTEHQAGSKQQFWSIMVQGKYAEQIAAALKNDLKVNNVKVFAAKGVGLSKHVRTAKV